MTNDERVDFLPLFAQLFPDLNVLDAPCLDKVSQQLSSTEAPAPSGIIAHRFKAGPILFDANLAVAPTASSSPFVLVPAHSGSGWTIYLATEKFTFPTELNVLGCLAVAYLRHKGLSVDRIVSLRVNSDYIQGNTQDPFTFFIPYNPNMGKFYLQVDALCDETYRLFTPNAPQSITTLTDKNFLDCLDGMRTAIKSARNGDPHHAAFAWLNAEHFRPDLKPHPQITG
jgi:hypothetical protein